MGVGFEASRERKGKNHCVSIHVMLFQVWDINETQAMAKGKPGYPSFIFSP